METVKIGKNGVAIMRNNISLWSTSVPINFSIIRKRETYEGLTALEKCFVARDLPKPFNVKDLLKI